MQTIIKNFKSPGEGLCGPLAARIISVGDSWDMDSWQEEHSFSQANPSLLL